jgi:hypothetical protein
MTRARTRYARRPVRARGSYRRRRYSRSPRLNVGLIALIVVAVVLVLALI